MAGWIGKSFVCRWWVEVEVDSWVWKLEGLGEELLESGDCRIIGSWDYGILEYWLWDLGLRA